MKPVYAFKNGLRLVETYQHQFIAFAKQRWIGQGLLDIYTKEFLVFRKQYYEEAIEKGLITVNGKQVACTYKV